LQDADADYSCSASASAFGMIVLFCASMFARGAICELAVVQLMLAMLAAIISTTKQVELVAEIRAHVH